MAVAGVAAMVAVPKLAKAAWLWARNGSLAGSLAQVVKTVIFGLRPTGALAGIEAEDASIEARKTLSGRVDIIAHGCSRAGERAVMQSMSEIRGPAQNPRYLLERRSWLGRLSRSDYHAVPFAIAAKRPDGWQHPTQSQTTPKYRLRLAGRPQMESGQGANEGDVHLGIGGQFRDLHGIKALCALRVRSYPHPHRRPS